MRFLLLTLFLIGYLAVPGNAQNKAELPNLQAFNKFYTKLGNLVRNQEIDLSQNYRIRIKSEILDGQISSWKLVLPLNENRTLLLELLGDFGRAVEDSKVFQIVALKEQDESITEAEIDINFEEENANFIFRFKTNSVKSAEKIASRFKLLFATAARLMQKQPAVEFYKNAGFEVEKDKFFFSTKISRQNLALYLRDW